MLSFERPFLCESGEQWLAKCPFIVLTLFVCHKFDLASFLDPSSCAFNSRTMFTEKESAPVDVLCLSVGI